MVALNVPHPLLIKANVPLELFKHVCILMTVDFNFIKVLLQIFVSRISQSFKIYI